MTINPQIQKFLITKWRLVLLAGVALIVLSGSGAIVLISQKQSAKDQDDTTGRTSTSENGTIGAQLKSNDSSATKPGSTTKPNDTTTQKTTTTTSSSPTQSTTPSNQSSTPSSSQSNTPPTSSNFQPTAPYYATFFYPWFKNAATDGSWSGSGWSDSDAGGTHSPPTNWFSNYLPDPNPSSFDPASELYSSNSYTTFKWQMSKLAEAKQEVAITSWWGQGHKTDITFSKIANDFMKRSDNPYPRLRWAFYYEKEGNVVNGTSDPSVATIVSDLNYLKAQYNDSPYLLKIGGKPVVFVYADPSDGAGMAQRWHDANAQTGNAFYINLKVFTGFASDPNQPDSWHQYAPANRANNHAPYSYAISPGFWLSGDTVRLTRDLSAFQSAVSSMVASSSTWKLTTTWNEWGEGTAVEPGTEVIQGHGATAAVQNPSGATFGNSFVQALADRLPPLE